LFSFGIAGNSHKGDWRPNLIEANARPLEYSKKLQINKVFLPRTRLEVFMNIYVGNLAWEIQEEDLRQLFEPYGTVDSVAVIKDKLSNRSKGFGFVEMPITAEAQEAIKELNGKEVRRRALRVNEAQPRAESGGFKRERRDRNDRNY